MVTFQRRLVHICFIYVLSVLAAFSQSNKVNYTFEAPVIDGVIDSEWSEFESNQVSNIIEGEVSSSTDLDGTFKMLWNEDFLYLLVVVNDDVVHSSNGDDISLDDGIEIFIDGNNDKPNIFEDDDFRFAFRTNDQKVYEYSKDTVIGVRFSQTVQTNTVIYEVQIPWNVIGQGNIRNYEEIGFDIHLNDNDEELEGDDEEAEREGKLAWFATENSNNNPSLFGTIVLSGKPSLGILAEPIFSKKRGFYKEPFMLILNSAKEETEIIYTLDGSDPRISPTAIRGMSPVSIDINPSIVANRGGLTPSVVVRALAAKSNYENSEIVTHSYIFLEHVKNQINPGGIWPPPYVNNFFNNNQEIDYEMDPDIVNATAYRDSIEMALLQLPTFSIVTDNDNLFDPNTGIYLNAIEQGSQWERPASIELINPDSTEGFQINGGIRIRGGYSRLNDNPKHSFRLFFRNKYGDSKLDFPLFGEEGTDSYDKIDLSTAQNYSWSKEGSNQNNFVKDMVFRDIQGKMNHPYTRSRYIHLYINGMYWGLFHTQERPDARSASDYMGGSEDDYDVMKPENNLQVAAEDKKVIATDGNSEAALRLWNMAIAGFPDAASYYRVQGLNTDGSKNSTYERLLDVDNLIDYLQLALYGDGYDSPLTSWTVNPIRPNNYFAIYNRVNPDGFKWYVHDFEHTMNTKNNETNIGVNNQWLITKTLANLSTDFVFFNPYFIHLKLMENEEYKMRFADRAFKNLTAGGLLSPDSLRAAFINRMEQFDVAIIAESARWGDAQVTVPKTKLTWLAALNRILNQYVPYRTDVVLQQFKDRLGYPVTEAPEFVFNNELLIGESKISELGDIISIYNANGSLGDIYYTTDGTDPRAVGGGVGNTAKTGNDTLLVNLNTTIELKARIFNDGEWSALKEMMFIINNPLGKLRVTEVHYNPIDYPNVNGSELEFIELKNTGTETINLTGVSFVQGIDFQFYTESIAPGAFVVLSSNALAFNKVYGFMPNGEYTGSLDNSGEKLTLVNAACDTIFSFEYKDGSSWPASADGLGNSLVPVNPNPEGSPAEFAYWRASSQVGGSPGKDDPNPSIVPIRFNEILSNSEYPETDRIELYNPSSNSVDISYWFLSDDKKNLKKWRIPAGSSIPAKGYKTFSEGHYTGTELSSSSTEFGSAFGISSHGETVYLLSANADSALTGYGTQIEVGEELANVSFGTHITSTKDTHFVAQSAQSFGSTNAYPKVGPVIINDIMYHPNDGNYEYVEIKNISNATVNLFADDNAENTWKISGLGFSFPRNCKINDGESIFIIEQGISATDFKMRYSLSDEVQIFNMNSALSNGGELLELKKPATQYIKDNMWVYEDILVDAVKYNDKLPWPQNADGAGYALARINENEYANDPINWTGRKVTEHLLFADTIKNSVGNEIIISFPKDVLWRDAIAQIKLNELILNPTDYTIIDSAIVINAALFTHSGNYSVTVLAPKFNPSSVNQVIRGIITAPILLADESDNYIDEAVTLLFEDDALWREKIGSVKLNNMVLASEKYTIASGSILFDSSLFTLADTYTITIEADNYTDAVVEQVIKNYKQSPQLVSDSTNNTSNQDITINFDTNSDWVTAIEAIEVNNSVIDQSLYSITDSTIVINKSVFVNSGEYSIRIKALFYNDVTLVQTIKCSQVVDAGSQQVICVTDSVALSGIVSEPGAIQWKTLNNGIFENSAALKTIYIPSTTEKETGKAVLVLQTVATEFCNMVSDTVVIIFNQATKIVSQVSFDTTTCEDEKDFELSVTASGSGTITYQWYSQLGTIENAVLPQFTVSTDSASTGSYYCVVGSACGSDVTSETSTIVIYPKINVTLSVSICAGETYQFGNQKLNSSNTYTQTFTSVYGCDSAVTLTLQVKDLPVVSLANVNTSCGLSNGSITAIVTAGSGNYSYQWSNDSTAALIENLSAGIYSLTVNDDFCSVSAQAVINEIGAPEISASSSTEVLCYGSTTEITAQGADTYAWSPALGLDVSTGGVVLCSARSSTTYQIKGTKDGCSSFTEITIKVNPSYIVTDSITVAWGQTYTFADEVLSLSGTYSKVLSTQYGCDSLVTLVLTVLEPESFTVELNKSECESYTFDNNILTQTGIYIDSLKTVQGADSIVILNLTIMPKYSIQFSDTIAYGESYVLGDKTITESGIYIENFTSVYGCDSVVTLTLQVLEPESKLVEITLNACNSYFFDGKYIYESGIYRDSLKTIHGADSVVVLTLTILPSYFESLLKTVGYGESFIFGKDTLTESGYYTALFQSISGCDSIVELTLNVLAPEEKTTYLTQHACEEFTFAGKRLTQTGIYKDVQKTYQGADSTIVLDLTINKTYRLSKDTILVNGQNLQFGMQEITNAGTYTELFYTQAGCDSIVTLNVKTIVTGLKESDSDRIKVYPVNAQNEVHVEFQGDAFIIVTDILGRVVFQTKAHRKHTFQLDQLPEGLYIVFVKQNEIEHKLFEVRR